MKNNTLKLISIGLFLLVIILSCLLYLQYKELEIYKNLQSMNSRSIEKYREDLSREDSIIECLNETK